MDRTGHITDLITMYTAMRNEPGVNKKAINKTVARLEEAELWSKQIQPGRINGVPPTSQAVHGAAEAQCTCRPGVIDKVNCPVHKQQ